MKIGDVVEFMGVPMTISDIKGNVARCQWFVNGKLNEGSFNLLTLKAR